MPITTLVKFLPFLLTLLGRGDGLTGVIGEVIKVIDRMTPEEQEAPIPPPVDVTRAQELLKKAGFDPGPIDGRWGSKTAAAVVAYQKANPPLVVDGLLGQQTLESLIRDNT